jgi:hypothetical protein
MTDLSEQLTDLASPTGKTNQGGPTSLRSPRLARTPVPLPVDHPDYEEVHREEAAALAELNISLEELRGLSSIRDTVIPPPLRANLPSPLAATERQTDRQMSVSDPENTSTVAESQKSKKSKKKKKKKGGTNKRSRYGRLSKSIRRRTKRIKSKNRKSKRKSKSIKMNMSEKNYNKLLNMKLKNKKLSKTQKKSLDKALHMKYCNCVKSIKYGQKNPGAYAICAHSVYKNRGLDMPFRAARDCSNYK